MALIKLRKAIYHNNGIALAGIFRLAGSEQKMIVIKKALIDGTFEETQNMPGLEVANAATLITVCFM